MRLDIRIVRRTVTVMDPFKALAVVARSTSTNFFFGFGTLSYTKNLGVRITWRFRLYRITCSTWCVARSTNRHHGCGCHAVVTGFGC